MFTGLHFRRELRRLKRIADTDDAPIREAYEIARKESRFEDAQELASEGQYYRRMHQEEVQHLVTRFLLSQADKRLLPHPNSDDAEMWETTQQSGYHVLTASGVAHIRGLLREEQKEERARMTFWVSVVGGGIIGIVGALTGLVSVLTK
jgi:hypothetical protein